MGGRGGAFGPRWPRTVHGGCTGRRARLRFPSRRRGRTVERAGAGQRRLRPPGSVGPRGSVWRAPWAFGGFGPFAHVPAAHGPSRLRGSERRRRHRAPRRRRGLGGHGQGAAKPPCRWTAHPAAAAPTAAPTFESPPNAPSPTTAPAIAIAQQPVHCGLLCRWRPLLDEASHVRAPRAEPTHSGERGSVRKRVDPGANECANGCAKESASCVCTLGGRPPGTVLVGSVALLAGSGPVHVCTSGALPARARSPRPWAEPSAKPSAGRSVFR